MSMYLPLGHLLQNGKYKLAERVGQGGFGITYKGIWFAEVKGSLGKMSTGVPVCIKEYFFKDYCLRDPETYEVKVHSETGRILFHKFKEKLIKEARILSEVHHPYIVNVLEVFEENQTAYIVMEYIAGSSLKQRLETVQVLSENRMLKYIRQIGEALQFVHEKNILHLDIKPSNILIDREDKARLIDFGVSKRYDIEEQETSTTMLTLSKGFASIEQYDDEGTTNFSPCPDIYSLGATMYNLLTGKIPVESILRATKELVAPKNLNPSISDKTNAAILKAMRIVPADRFQTVAEMLDALDVPQPEAADEQGIPAGEQTADDETTLLSAPEKNGTPADDSDATILNQPGIPAGSSLPRRRKLVIPMLIALVVVLASAGVLYVQHRVVVAVDTVADTLATVAGVDTTAVEPAGMPEDHAVLPTQANTVGHASYTQAATSQSSPAEGPATVTQQLRQLETPHENQPSAVVSETEKTAAYQSLLSTGNAKMSQGDYAAAKKDFEEARTLIPTEEANRLILAADAHLEAQIVTEKKALYEEKMYFGPYMIVRKKTTGAYGAIDNKGNEVIPCKYQSVGRAETGRTFLRTDNLFDIYGENGELLSEGVANY